MSKRTSILGIIWGIIVVGCGDGEQRNDASVLRSKAPDSGQPSAELQRKRAMQAITVKDEESHGLYEIEDYTSLERTLYVECFRGAYGTEADPDCGTPEGFPETCTAGYRQVQACIAAALTDLARGNDAVLPNLWGGEQGCGEWKSPIFPGGAGPYRIMPLTPAQKIGVITEARRVYVDLIRGLSADIGYNRCGDENGDQKEAAAAIVEAYQAYEEVTDLAVEADLAVADSEMASTPDTALAVQRSMSSPLYSHASAATWLVGGATFPDSERLLTFPGAGDGFCSLPRLSAQAEVAVRVLREAAPAPSAILAIPKNPLVPAATEISIDALLNQRGLDTGCILERLEHAWSTTIVDMDIATRLGLSQSAFVEARAYMAQEIRAFARSMTQYSGPADPPQFRHYTSTANPPADRSSAYYAAIGRSSKYLQPGWSWYNDRPFDTFECTTDMTWLTAYGRGYGLDRFREDMLNYLNCMEHWTQPSNVAPLLAIRSAINRVKQETITHDYHRQEDAWRTWDYSNVRITSGAVASRGYRLVRGEEALECLTLGSVDGVDCSGYASLGDPGNSWNVCDLSVTSGNYACVIYPPQASGTWYLLRSQGPANWVPAGGGNSGHWDTPIRQWQPVTGFVPVDPLMDSGEVTPQRTIPVYSDIEARLKKILQPSKSWCTKSERNCLGLREDDPIPLENELSRDDNDRESSWKYYLTMAKDAAAKSDDLAMLYFDAALSVDQLKVDEEKFQLNKQEQAVAKLEELQAICGTSVAATDLLHAIQGLSDSVLSDRFDMKNLYLGSCSGSDGSATSVYDCVNGTRVVNFQKLVNLHPDLLDLKSCVDDLTDSSTTVDLVHLGNEDLCVPDVAINNACGTKDSPCPPIEIAQATSPTCPTDKVFNNAAVAYTIVPKEDGLAFFDTLADGTVSSGSEVCKDLRNFYGRTTQEMPDSLKSSPMLNFVNLREFAKTLSYEPHAGGYVTISGANGFKWTTGSTDGGPATGAFPCGTQDLPPECASGAGGWGLRCSPADCTDATKRAQINRRLLRAWAAARSSLWESGDDPISLKLPVYINWGAVPLNTSEDGNIQFWTSSGARSINKQVNTIWERYSDASNQMANASMWLGTTSSGQLDPWPLQKTSGDLGTVNFAFQSLESRPAAGATEPAKWQTGNAKRFWAGLGGATGEGCLLKALKTSIDNYSIAFYYCSESSFSASTGVSSAYALNFGTPPMYERCGGNSNDTFEAYCLRDPGGAKARLDAWYHANPNYGYSLAGGGGGLEIIPSSTSGYSAMLDGVELMCEVSAAVSGDVDCGTPPPPIGGVDDLYKTGVYMDCLGRQISAKGATAVFKGIPKAVLDPLRTSSGTVYSSASGEIGQQIENLKVALLDAYKTQQTIGHVIRQFGQEMKALQSTIHSYVIESNISEIKFEAKQTEETSKCMAAIASLSGVNTLFNPGSVGAAAANCANSMAQIKFADKMRGLEKDKYGAQTETAIARFNQSFDEKAQILDGQSTELSEALYRINQAIGRVADLRSSASRILTEATWLLSNDAKSTAKVRSGMESRKAIHASRYKAALENSKRLAFLAKRAIEQRLGLHMDSMMEDLPLVEAPARWESSLCFGSYPGLNYQWLSSPNRPSSEDESNSVVGGFIGDYVTKLENVVESYRLANGFQDGADTAVISLRDDILNVRRQCQVASKNLLVSTADLTPNRYGAMGAGKGWFIAGCNETLAGNVTGQSPPNCIKLTKEAASWRPSGAEVDVPIYRMTFGGGTASSDPCNGVPSGTCGYLPDAMLAQRVKLPSGKYALTWYQQSNSNADESVIEAVLSNEAALQVLRPSQTLKSGIPWTKKIAIFSLSSESEVTIGFRKGELNDAGNAGRNPAFWSAPMLERITDAQYATDPWYAISVGSYELTDAAGLAPRTTCEDHGGEAFRGKWNRGCMYLCPDGYSTNCQGFAKESCYKEIAFPMTQWGLESNQQFVQSGFARGNFNYRIHRIGLNFVGTGLRNCADSSLPQSCYSGAYVNYSLEHQGPFAVRNHYGTDFIASLYDGRIEHARGLAAERYVSNPIGTTDKSLLSDYMRGEMSGRPLSGTFVLRVWDDPNLDFEAIEDVQLVLEYGYWTRLAK